MDPEYEHRLLRQINIQNDNLSPVVSHFLLVYVYVVFVHWTWSNLALTYVKLGYSNQKNDETSFHL